MALAAQTVTGVRLPSALRLSERVVQRRSVDSVHADQLVTRTLTPHDRHPRRGNARPASDQATQRAIRAPVDRRRADACNQDAVADADEFVTVCTGVKPDRDPRVRHGIE